MTHFSPAGETTGEPQSLSTLEKVGVLVAGVNIHRPANSRTPSDLDLPFQTHRVPSSGGQELEIWHIPHPAPRAAVAMFHGYHSMKSNLLDQAQWLHETGCAVFLVDFRGSGGSTGNATTLGVHEADDVAAAARLAQELLGDRPLILFGESMGSTAILRAVAHGAVHPAGAIVECPFDRLLVTIGHRFPAMGLPSFPFAELLLFWGSAQHTMNGFDHNPVGYAPLVTCPILQLHGELDPWVSIAEAKAIFDRLPGDKQFELFSGVGHEPYYRARPEDWRQHVAAFLDRYARAPRN